MASKAPAGGRRGSLKSGVELPGTRRGSTTGKIKVMLRRKSMNAYV